MKLFLLIFFSHVIGDVEANVYRINGNFSKEIIWLYVAIREKIHGGSGLFIVSIIIDKRTKIEWKDLNKRIKKSRVARVK